MRCALRLAVLAMVGVLVSGCAGGGGDAVPSSASSATAAVTASMAPAAPKPVIGPVSYDKDAVAKFGKPQVVAAGEFATAFVARFGAQDALIRQTPKAVTVGDLEEIMPLLTARGRQALTKSVGLLDSNQGQADTYSFAFVGLDAGGYTVRRDVPGVVDVKVADGVVHEDDGQFVVEVKFSSVLRFKDAQGANFKMTATKDVTLWLTKGPDAARPFLVDKASAGFGGTEVAPDKG